MSLRADARTGTAQEIWDTPSPARPKETRTGISLGAMSMAHRGAAIPAAASFFIVHEPQPHLDGVHTVFGQVTDNLQAVRQMRNGDVMKSVTIDEA